jgi:glutaredoxin-related protein
MAALIRLSGETDTEFQRRCAPFFKSLGAMMMAKEFVEIYKSRSVLTDFLRARRVRDVASEVCWPKKFDEPGTFTWEIADGRTTPSP